MDEGVTVTGFGHVEVTPDQLLLALRLSCSAAGVAEAFSRLTARTEAVVGTVIDRGVNRADVRTAGLQVEQEWSGERTVRRTGFRAAHRITVLLRDITNFGPLLNAVLDVADDDLRIDQVETTSSTRLEASRQAREAAFEDAHSRAEQLAGLAARRLAGVTWVSEHPGQSRPGENAARAAMAGSGDFEVQSGTTTISSAVTVCWGWT